MNKQQFCKLMSEFQSVYEEQFDLIIKLKMNDSVFEDIQYKFIDLFINTMVVSIGEEHRESLDHFIFETDFGKKNTWFKYLNVEGVVESIENWWELEFNPYEFIQRFTK